MSANRRQPLEAAYVAASATTRRRSLPPRPIVPVPMSLHQRWRERPRCRALHLTPGHPDGVVHAIVRRVACRCLRTQFVQENRAARVHIHEARSVPMCSAGIGSRTTAVLLKNTTTIGTSSEPHLHRADDAGAVLGVVNALRFASTRPVAGPSGIDDTCARHRSATTRWWAI